MEKSKALNNSVSNSIGKELIPDVFNIAEMFKLLINIVLSPRKTLFSNRKLKLSPVSFIITTSIFLTLISSGINLLLNKQGKSPDIEIIKIVESGYIGEAGHKNLVQETKKLLTAKIYQDIEPFYKIKLFPVLYNIIFTLFLSFIMPSSLKNSTFRVRFSFNSYFFTSYFLIPNIYFQVLQTVNQSVDYKIYVVSAVFNILVSFIFTRTLNQERKVPTSTLIISSVKIISASALSILISIEFSKILLIVHTSIKGYI